MKKKLLAMFLTVCMALSLLPVSALAVTEDRDSAFLEAGEVLLLKEGQDNPAEGQETAPVDGTVPPEENLAFTIVEGRVMTPLAPFGESATQPGRPARVPAKAPTKAAYTKEYYGSQLTTDNAKNVYSALVAAKDSILRNNGSTTAGKIDITYSGTNQIDLMNAVSAFNRDYPEVFWTGDLVTWGPTDSNNNLTSITGVGMTYSKSWENSSAEQISQQVTALNNAVTTLANEAKKAGKTDYEQLKYVHDWLTKNNAYNSTAAADDNYSETTNSTPWTPLSALKIDGAANPVCEGYARAFKLVADKLDIPSILVSGSGHMWNYVQVDVDGADGPDAWYGMDVTFDDPVSADSSTGHENWTYFLTNNWKNDEKHKESSEGYIQGAGAVYHYPTLAQKACPVPITAITVGDIPAPVKGAMPMSSDDAGFSVKVTYAKVGANETAETVELQRTSDPRNAQKQILWKDENEYYLGFDTDYSTFAPGKTYTAEISLQNLGDSKCFNWQVADANGKVGNFNLGLPLTDEDDGGFGMLATLTRTYPATDASTVESVTVTAADSTTSLEIPGIGEAANTFQLTASAKYDDSANFVNVSSTATWAVTDTPAGVTVSGGLVTVTSEAAAGNVKITASLGGKSDTFELTLTKTPRLASLTLTPSKTEVFVPNKTESPDTSLTITAAGTDQYGDSFPLKTVRWNAALPSGAQCSNGSVTMTLTVNYTVMSSCPVIFTARVDDVTSSVQVAITRRPPVATTATIGGGPTDGSAILEPSTRSPFTEATSSTPAYTVTVLDQYGWEVKNPGTAVWSITKAPGVSVNQNGVVTVTPEAQAGKVTLTGTVGGISATKVLTVQRTPQSEMSGYSAVRVFREGAAQTRENELGSISGSSSERPTSLAKPGESGVPKTYTFVAQSYDRYGEPFTDDRDFGISWLPGKVAMVNGNTMWQSGALPDGVTYTADGKTVTITVTSAAALGKSFKLTAGKVLNTNLGTVIDSTKMTRELTCKITDKLNADLKITRNGVELPKDQGGYPTIVGSFSYGDTVTLTASVENTDGTGTWKWVNNHPSIVGITGADTNTVTLKALTAGTAGVQVTYEDDTYKGSAIVQVSPRTIPLTVNVTAADKDYDGTTDVDLTTTVAGGINGEKPTVTVTGAPANANAGEKTFNVTVTLDAAYQHGYTLATAGEVGSTPITKQVTMTIRQADPVVGTVKLDGSKLAGKINSSGAIYDNTAVTDVAAALTRVAGEGETLTNGGALALRETALTVGTKNYTWVYTPADSTNYRTKEGTISLTVVADPLASITVTTNPTKTSYAYGDALATAGAVITATYESGTTKVIPLDEAIFSPTKFNTVGDDQTVTVSYGGKMATFTVSVGKAAWKNGTRSAIVLNSDVTVHTVDLRAFLPTDGGTFTYAVATTDSDSIIVDGEGNTTAAAADGKLTFTQAADVTGEKSATVVVTVTSTNYANFTVTVTINSTGKKIPTISAGDLTKVYDGTAYTAGDITSTATAIVDGETVTVPGEWAFEGGVLPKNVADSGTWIVVFTPTDGTIYATVETTITVTITRAQLTGDPIFTEVSAAGTTLSAVTLTRPAGWPSGTFSWTLPGATSVAQGTAYTWMFTPDDTNYSLATGSVTPWPAPVVTNYTITLNPNGGSVSPTTVTATGGVVPVLPVPVRSGYTFDGWFTPQNNRIVAGNTIGANVTLAAKWTASSGGGSSSGSSGGSSSGGNSVTVPVSGDRNSVNVAASVSGSTATVSKIDTAQINSAVGENGSHVVEVDFTGVGKTINTVNLPTAAIGDIARAVRNDDAGGLTVKLTNGEITFDGDALTAIQSQAGNQVSLTVTPARASDLNARQRESAGDAPVFDLTLKSGGRTISNFNGGYATVALSYRLKAGQDPSGVVVYYLDASGNIHACETTYDVRSRMVMFTTRHLSLYFVGYDESAVSREPGITENRFTDVQSSAYYYDAVAWAVKQGITVGTSAAVFSPNASCTRAQTVTFLWRAAGSPAPRGSANPFTDIQPGTYYYDAVLWAVEQGITAGTSETTFSPDATVTRGQTVTFLYRAAGSPVADGSNPFGDVASNAYYANAVQWAVDKGITVGTSTATFSPDANCTRAQIVTFLYQDRAN